MPIAEVVMTEAVNAEVSAMDRLNRWLTLLTNMGVLLGLVFVALEVQQNTRAMSNETDVAVYSLFAEHQRLVVEEPEVAELLVRSETQQYHEMSKSEQWVIGIYFGGLMDNTELQFRLYERSEETVENIAFPEQLFGFPAFKGWWRQYSHLYQPDFVAFMDDLMSSRASGT
jgi:hypothetical protein